MNTNTILVRDDLSYACNSYNVALNAVTPRISRDLLDNVLLSRAWLAGHVYQSRDTGTSPDCSNDICIWTKTKKKLTGYSLMLPMSPSPIHCINYSLKLIDNS